MNEEGQIGEGQPPEDTGEQWSQQPQQPPPQQQPPQAAQQSQQQQRLQGPPQKDFIEKITSNDNLTKMIAVGFVILLVGMLVIHASSFVTNYDGKELGASPRDDYDEDKILTEKEKQDDQAFQNAMEYTGRMITDIGIFFIGALLAMGGIARDDLDTKYRMVMISLSILLILVAWFGFLTAVPIALPNVG
ncbi:MAG: hypothetical protein KGY66_06810 [Candidatus Thermoplasmatota archaeon]|nr:hypothetical protein [Candidatus Thermoplasmatota archaeon]MBS3790610.1 hypothetical protein [Candidatus Thermoplasmatota archaeon]